MAAFGSNGQSKSASASSLVELTSSYRQNFAALERFLLEQVEIFEPEMRPLVRDCLQHSGKKLRPLLVFALYDGGEEVAPEAVIRAAAVVELVHLATLVHDDILDEAVLRHRTETMVSRYGAHVAVLLGDALFAHALELAADYPDGGVCRAVARATRQVCSGEIAQTFARKESVPSVENYLRMIDLKTAELFKVSAWLGGWLQEFGEEPLRAASEFAGHLGIAYQILDDTADIFAEEGVLGKTLGTDLETGKMTLPVLYWLDGLMAGERETMTEELRLNQVSLAELRERLLAREVGFQVEERFRNELEKAVACVNLLPGRNRRERLLGLVAYLSSLWNKVGPKMLQPT